MINLDLSAMIAAALQHAIDQATTPLRERVADLERDVSALLSRIEHHTTNAITVDLVDSLIESALYRIDWNSQVHAAVGARLDNLDGQQADAITADQINHLIKAELKSVVAALNEAIAERGMV